MNMRPGRHWKILLTVIVIGVFIILPYLAPSKYWVSLVEQSFIFGLFAASLGLLMGYAGMTSLGHAVFFGSSAYVTAVLSVKFGFGGLAAGLWAVLANVVLATIVGLATARMRGVTFMMITVAFAQIFWGLALQWQSMTGGDNGIVGVPKPIMGGLVFEGVSFYYLLLFMFCVCVWLLMRIASSPFGLALKGIKESESRMRMLGYNVWLLKIVSVVVSACFASIAGVMWVWFNSFVGTDDLAVMTSAKAIIMVLIGGVGTIIGPILGAFAIVFGQDYVSGYTDRWLMVMGVLYIVVVLYMKGGMVGIIRKLYLKGRSFSGEASKDTPK